MLTRVYRRRWRKRRRIIIATGLTGSRWTRIQRALATASRAEWCTSMLISIDIRRARRSTRFSSSVSFCLLR